MNIRKWFAFTLVVILVVCDGYYPSFLLLSNVIFMSVEEWGDPLFCFRMF